MRALTSRQERFVEEYLVDLNATQAAIRAGYKSENADVTGPRLVAQQKVADAIHRAKKERSLRTEITTDAVLAELGRLAFTNMLDFVVIGADGYPRFDFSTLTRDKAAALQEMTIDDLGDAPEGGKGKVRRVRFRLSDKRAALTEMLRHLAATPAAQPATQVQVNPFTQEEMTRLYGTRTGASAEPVQEVTNFFDAEAMRKLYGPKQ